MNRCSVALLWADFPPDIIFANYVLNILTKSSGAEYSLKYTG